MTASELALILAAHAEWLKDSKKGKRANLTEANLTDANLTNASIWAGWVLTKEQP